MPDILEMPVRSPRSVLVVDDHPDTLTLSKMMLEVVGHEVYAAADGNSALDLALEKKPEVIFSDLVLPGLDGFSLCKKLRKETALDQSVLFAYSGRSDYHSVALAAEAGFDYFAVKPVSPDFFWNCVYAPRQAGLILLSEILLQQSHALKKHGAALSKHASEARQRSRALIEKFSQRYLR